jgi:anti-sigma factor RsiW
MFRRYLATHSEEDWETYRLARNQKGKVIKAALRRGFRNFIEEAVDPAPRGCGEWLNGPETGASSRGVRCQY